MAYNNTGKYLVFIYLTENTLPIFGRELRKKNEDTVDELPLSNGEIVMKTRTNTYSLNTRENDE